MFGKFIQELRRKKGLGLCEFCKKTGHDPSNWSKLERGILPPPKDERKLRLWASQLGLEPGSGDWYTFFDLASVEGDHLLSSTDRNMVKELPQLFRIIRGQKPTEDEMRNLAALARRS
ncbi:MAG: helix-turn-helix domain-containing protein [bacterium]|nr:helix-turn-helix domain-containing protein [bacterium]